MPSDCKRVLFVAYYFPPGNSVGVHRSRKFVQYLPDFGWATSVLTVANPSVPFIDQALLDDIPAETVIRRARTYEPEYAVKASVSRGTPATSHGPKQTARRLVGTSLRNAANLVLQPDPQILWRPRALQEGRKLLKEVRHDAILASGPPFSSLMLGATLARESGLPLVLDYRDEWTISNTYWENRQQGWLSSKLQARMERNAMRAADLILATTPSTAKELARQAQAVRSRAKTAYIYNGFDPLDYPAPDPASQRVTYGDGAKRFRMVHPGTLWNLTPIGPVIDAILELAQRSRHLAEHLELVVAGRRTGPQEAELDRLRETPVKLVRLPFMSQKEAIRLMCDADALLLINADLPNTSRIVNAKTFEYMAARRPIFVVAPKGDMWDVVRDLPGTILCEPKERERMAECLAVTIERWRSNIKNDPNDWDVARFERRHQAGELAQLLSDLPVPKRVAGS